MNLSTFIILVILAVIIGAVVRIMIRDKKAGKGCGGCAGGCGGCAGSSMCHGYHEHGKREVGRRDETVNRIKCIKGSSGRET